MGSTGMHVALLRGINVGGKNKLPMKGLLPLFVDAGCSDVTAYIQSGNVIFRAERKLAGRISGLIAEAISDRFGLRVPVVTRAAAELEAVARSNPFLRSGADEDELHVAFLADRPAAARVAALDHERSPPDQFILLDREIYLHCPQGLGRTRLTNAYFDAQLDTTSTVRNWRTVLKLVELCRQP